MSVEIGGLIGLQCDYRVALIGFDPLTGSKSATMELLFNCFRN